MSKPELDYFPDASAGRRGYLERVRRIFTEYLSRHGLRLTRQRSLILDHLLDSERHVSVEEIYAALRGKGIGRATVFRTVKMLEACSLAGHVTGAGGTTRFEIHVERPHHDHLICVHCGGIQEIRWPQLERIQQGACKKLGFAPLWHRHEIFGRCAGCRERA